MKDSHTTLLLGGGYTLGRVARLLPEGSYIISTTNADRLTAWERAGIPAALINVSKPGSLVEFLKAHPSIHTIVDSVPTLHGAELDAPLRAKLTVSICTELKEVRSQLARLIYLGTTGVYGREDGSVVDESTEIAPKNVASSARALCEEYYRSVEVPLCVFRISAIYGAGRGLGLMLQSGSYRLIEDGSRWSNRIQVEDLALAISKAVQFDGTLPPVLNASDNEPTQSKDVVEWYCSKFNIRPPGRITRAEAEQRGSFTMLGNQRVSNALLRETLQISLKYPTFREGAGTEFLTSI